MAQRRTSIADAGENLGETRRERPPTLLAETDLAELTAEEAEQAVRKDSIWPNPDWAALVGAGCEPRAAALVKLVRDRIPGRPSLDVHQYGTTYGQHRQRDAALVRRDYVRMLGIVRDVLMACRTADEVRQARAIILRRAGWTPQAGPETRHLVTAVFRGRVDTLQIDYRDLIRVESMVREGWPGGATPSWRKGHTVLADGEGGYLLTRGVQIIADGFAAEADAWAWLKAQHESGRQAAPPRLPLPERPVLDAPRRDGLPDRRGGRDIAVHELLRSFGLRAAEFGKWVPQAERQTLLNQTFEALHDLADALELPADALGLDGSLALSFGARAFGATGADYDAGARAIALPRSGGAGELVRCWARAFDHWSGEVDGPPSSTPRFATGAAPRGREPTFAAAHLDAAAAAAWRRLTLAIWRGDPDTAVQAAAQRDDLARREAEIADAERQRDAYLARTAPGARDAGYLDGVERWLGARRDTVLPALRAQVQRLETAAAAAGESRYVAQARALCGRDGDVWLRPGELFARAVECLVHDRLTARGACNERLVHGVEEERFATGYRGNPYPTGEERHRLRDAVSATLAALAPRMTRAHAGPTAPEDRESPGAAPPSVRAPR